MKEKNKETFKDKLKDKKYKAKLELTIGFGLMIILFIYASVSGVNNNYNYNNTININETLNEETFILDKITNNYSYDIIVSLTKIDDIENNNLVQYNYTYAGKTYDDNTIINKIVDNNTITYYKIDNEYYSKEDDNYILSNEETIYDLIDSKYINIDTIKEYISNATLDHTTNYSNGNISYVYNLEIKEIIKSYQEDDSIKIEVDIIDDLPTIVIDYTNLLKVIDTDNNINECKVDIKYSDINEVEEFTIIEETE